MITFSLTFAMSSFTLQILGLAEEKFIESTDQIIRENFRVLRGTSGSDSQFFKTTPEKAASLNI